MKNICKSCTNTRCPLENRRATHCVAYLPEITLEQERRQQPFYALRPFAMVAAAYAVMLVSFGLYRVWG